MFTLFALLEQRGFFVQIDANWFERYKALKRFKASASCWCLFSVIFTTVLNKGLLLILQFKKRKMYSSLGTFV